MTDSRPEPGPRHSSEPTPKQMRRLRNFGKSCFTIAAVLTVLGLCFGLLAATIADQMAEELGLGLAFGITFGPMGVSVLLALIGLYPYRRGCGDAKADARGWVMMICGFVIIVLLLILLLMTAGNLHF
jgi:hypothetical protein